MEPDDIADEPEDDGIDDQDDVLEDHGDELELVDGPSDDQTEDAGLTLSPAPPRRDTLNLSMGFQADPNVILRTRLLGALAGAAAGYFLLGKRERLMAAVIGALVGAAVAPALVARFAR